MVDNKDILRLKLHPNDNNQRIAEKLNRLIDVVVEINNSSDKENPEK